MFGYNAFYEVRYFTSKQVKINLDIACIWTLFENTRLGHVFLKQVEINLEIACIWTLFENSYRVIHFVMRILPCRFDETFFLFLDLESFGKGKTSFRQA